VFAQAGQWVGDHDMRAMACCYKMRIVVSRVIYDDQIEECVYEPEEGTKPRGELRVILDRKLFWAVKTLEAFEKQVAGEETEVEEQEVEVVKKPRSALEKVMAKYGKKDEEDEEVQQVAKIVPKKSDKGEKSIIGFKNMHTVSVRIYSLHGARKKHTCGFQKKMFVLTRDTCAGQGCLRTHRHGDLASRAWWRGGRVDGNGRGASHALGQVCFSCFPVRAA